ncbi:hypothetical protein F383_17250 [Gossypium arboreum]|uniref:Uncharacterized protein n=1 Tax=Gossypium arboreum TaxID=29729 RepID=A0A0B0MU96_GOSAR|nr:hypothetical protein F383_27563 [Gossypium arboreum]KHG07596.1 hypothetical protein F383_34583 [Gossypium arboreum]KHG15393.1 hypothetical protein F383_17250 [Gossypium arboreum]
MVVSLLVCLLLGILFHLIRVQGTHGWITRP